MNSDSQGQQQFVKQSVRPLLAMAVLVLLRYALSASLPPYIISNSPHDDGWVVQKAGFLLNGGWLGPYNQYTLIKGVFSPLLMAFTRGIGVSYLGFNTALYCASCAIFIAAIAPVFQRNWVRLTIFTVLLFNPISYALQTWQRIYRNGISQWQILLIFGAIFAVYIRRDWDWRVLLKWEILAGVALWSFINTREDGVWMYPFVLCAILVTIIAYCWQIKTWKTRRIALFVLPLVILLLGNICLKMINFNVYGAAVINDRAGGNYAKVVRDLYLIDPDPESEKKFSAEEYQDQYYNIYTSTLKKAYRVSPTLSVMQSEIDDAVAMWDSWDTLVDGEPFADHILFAIRDGVAAAGHYTDLGETENLYGQIHKELTHAFQDGTIAKRGLSLTAMTAPFQWEDVSAVFAEIPKTLHSVVSFENVNCQIIDPTGPESGIAQFELMSGTRAVRLPQQSITAAGWAFAYQNGKVLSASVCTADGAPVANVQFLPSEDVFDFFLDNASTAYENARTCRFSLEILGYELSDQLILRFIDETGNIVAEVPLADAPEGEGVFNDDMCYCFDNLQDSSSGAEILYSGTMPFVNRANWVGFLYQRMNPFMFLMAVIIYGCFLGWLLLHPKQRTAQQTALCLLTSGLLLSLILFVVCMSYMTATTFLARQPIYLSSAYVLCIAFIVVSLGWGIQELLQRVGRCK